MQQEKLRKEIREIIQLLNDEALFHKRNSKEDFQSSKEQTPAEVRHSLYEAICSLIDVYDDLNEEEIPAHLTNEIKKISSIVKKITSN